MSVRRTAQSTADLSSSAPPFVTTSSRDSFFRIGTGSVTLRNAGRVETADFRSRPGRVETSPLMAVISISSLSPQATSIVGSFRPTSIRDRPRNMFTSSDFPAPGGPRSVRRTGDDNLWIRCAACPRAALGRSPPSTARRSRSMTVSSGALSFMHRHRQSQASAGAETSGCFHVDVPSPDSAPRCPCRCGRPAGMPLPPPATPDGA